MFIEKHKRYSKYSLYVAKYRINPYKIAKDLLNFAKGAKIRQIWSQPQLS